MTWLWWLEGLQCWVTHDSNSFYWATTSRSLQRQQTKIRPQFLWNRSHFFSWIFSLKDRFQAWHTSWDLQRGSQGIQARDTIFVLSLWTVPLLCPGRGDDIWPHPLQTEAPVTSRPESLFGKIWELPEMGLPSTTQAWPESLPYPLWSVAPSWQEELVRIPGSCKTQQLLTERWVSRADGCQSKGSGPVQPGNLIFESAWVKVTN